MLFHQDFCQSYFWEIDVTPAGSVEESFETPDAFILAAVNERKKRSEVKLKELSHQKRFAESMAPTQNDPKGSSRQNPSTCHHAMSIAISLEDLFWR